MIQLDQGIQPYPVHCMVCFVQKGIMVPATWEDKGYHFCDACKDVNPATMNQRHAT